MKQAAAAWEVGWERIGASWDNFFHSSTAVAAAKVVHNMSRKRNYYTVQTVNILHNVYNYGNGERIMMMEMNLPCIKDGSTT